VPIIYDVNFRPSRIREFPMRYDVLIAGFGGQGVLLAGNLLSYAALDAGKNVSYFPAYGVEKRGGTATCTVVIADGAVGSPVVGSPSVLVALNQGSLDRFGMKVRPGGFCIVNSSLADAATLTRNDIKVVPVAMNEIASELGDPRMVNMVSLGAYVALTGAVSIASLGDALKEALPERNHRFIPANLRAIEVGAQRAREKNATF
jgi:2-oxoglutarate ferredoxin oxidoreductase subunit gamma